MGESGSGKTTLAKKISEKLAIPHIHLDRFYFEAGGADVRRGSEKEKVMEATLRRNALAALQTESWVSDGRYLRILPEIGEMADTIIYLDIPMWRRLANHAKRALKPSLRHKELSAWHELKFFVEMVRRTLKGEQKKSKLIAKFGSKMIFLNSYREIGEYLQELF
jgi:adenylate kinase family enzyme